MPHTILIIDPKDRRREELALVLFSIGGFRVHQLRQIECSAIQMTKVDLVLVAEEIHLECPSSDDNSIVCFGSQPLAPKHCKRFIRLDLNRPPKFAEQVRNMFIHKSNQ